ncbi:MAG: two-component regulator propeller domain-containing protein, partial [Lautropia mirabilis]
KAGETGTAQASGSSQGSTTQAQADSSTSSAGQAQAGEQDSGTQDTPSTRPATSTGGQTADSSAAAAGSSASGQAATTGQAGSDTSTQAPSSSEQASSATQAAGSSQTAGSSGGSAATTGGASTSTGAAGSTSSNTASTSAATSGSDAATTGGATSGSDASSSTAATGQSAANGSTQASTTDSATQSGGQSNVQGQTSGATSDQTQDQDATSPSNSKTEGQGQQEAQNQSQTQGQTAGTTQDDAEAQAGQSQAQAAGFVDHGIPTPVAQTRGVVSTVDQSGQDVVLTWLQDWRGGYAILMVNAETGASQQFDVPFKPDGDEPSAIYLSSKNRLYTLFNSQFVEFDVASKRFTFHGKVDGKTAMSLTEDKDGRIWAGTYPNNQLVSFNPQNSSLQNHGQLAKESWAQYPRSIAADAHGWVYVGSGLAASQIYAYNIQSHATQALLPSTQRVSGAAVVGQSESNVVYARNGQQQFMLANGKASGLSARDQVAASNLKTGAQNMVDRDFPSGRRLVSVDMHDRTLVTRDASGQQKSVKFNYTTQGAALTFVCATGDNKVCGGTRFPMHTFYYSAGDNKFDSKQLPRQPNVMAALGSRLYVAAYPDGKLFQESENGKNEFDEVLNSYPTINRPHAMVIMGGGSQIALAGTPEYGMTGGGMMFWNRSSGQKTTVDHWHLVPNHSVQAMIELSNGMLLGGTTVAPGTGGVTKAGNSGELFLMDANSHEVRWHGAPVPGAKTITDLTVGADGLVYGLADSVDLFVFNPNNRQVVSVNRFSRELGPSVFAQGTRAFVKGADGSIYVLLYNGIGKVDTKAHTVTRVVSSPVRITVGGAAANGRIYFGSNNHLYSWKAQ